MHDPLNPDYDFSELWNDALEIWTAKEDDPAYSGYVSADYPAIYEALRGLRNESQTFLEWGSGLGVVAIMAAKMGFDSYGIEVEPELVEIAYELADRYEVSPIFGVGSFIPDELQQHKVEFQEFHRTQDDACSAYDELDMQLRDFDLVYAYPWPEEAHLFESIVGRFASPSTYYLSYDVREGLSLCRPASPSARRN